MYDIKFVRSWGKILFLHRHCSIKIIVNNIYVTVRKLSESVEGNFFIYFFPHIICVSLLHLVSSSFSLFKIVNQKKTFQVHAVQEVIRYWLHNRKSVKSFWNSVIQ